MKKLYLMRHAESTWGGPDIERKLNRRGEQDALHMGRYLQEQGVLLDVILCSTARRSKDTVTGVTQKYIYDGEILYIDELYQANHEIYLNLLNKLPSSIKTALLVAHNPTIEDFLEIVCSFKEQVTAASVAEIQFQIGQWSQLSLDACGELLNLWKPREI